MEKDLYLWTSTGGDSLCDAMSGYHEGAAPARPHPNCNCSLELASSAYNHYRAWYESHEYRAKGPGDLDYDLVAKYRYQVKCYDGTSKAGTFEITRDYRKIEERVESWPGDDWEIAWLEAFASMDQEADSKASDIAYDFCPRPLIS